MADFYPIVYVRGYAMRESEVEDTFNKPYYGFNLGSTQFRLSADETPTMRIFESPVVRLIKQERYVDSFNRFLDRKNRPVRNSVPEARPAVDWRRTLWTFRFYDRESQLLGESPREEIEGYARDLALFLDEVRRACGSPPDFRVNLVAHSMGGLITRCYLQNKGLFQQEALRGVEPVVINKMFTYGTPHGGITFRRGLGWVENVRDLVGAWGSDTFGEKRMREFLSLPEESDLRVLDAARQDFDISRVFCLVGTNYKDYTVWISKRSVGPGSDGLVAIENAYMKGASRAYVHLAHSGPFGMVNSEEGYQNLKRFLFGDIRYEITLEPIHVKRQLPEVQKDDKLDYLLVNTNVVIRGLSTYVQVRQEGNQSAIVLPMLRSNTEEQTDNFAGEHLYTGYMSRSEIKVARSDGFMRGAIDLHIEPHYTHEGWIRTSRFEGEAVLNDRLHLAYRFGADGVPSLKYRWRSMMREKTRDREADGSFLFPLPESARRYLDCAGVRVRAFPWT